MKIDDIDNEDFNRWLLSRAANMPTMKMVDDVVFVERLCSSLAEGRSLKFNRSEKEAGHDSALNLLKREYIKEMEERDAR